MSIATIITATREVPHKGMSRTNLESFVMERLSTLRGLARRTAEETWLAGKGLAYLRDIYTETKKKEWMQFVETQLGISVSTASNLIRIGRAFDSIEEIRGLTVEEMKVFAGVYTEKQIRDAEARKAKSRAETKTNPVEPPQSHQEAPDETQGPSDPDDDQDATDEPQEQGPVSIKTVIKTVEDIEHEYAERVARVVEMIELLGNLPLPRVLRRKIEAEKLKASGSTFRKLVNKLVTLPQES